MMTMAGARAGGEARSPGRGRQPVAAPDGVAPAQHAGQVRQEHHHADHAYEKRYEQFHLASILLLPLNLN
jgi:hypothetical protein